MPYRDPSERLLKAGNGFSKMLSTLQLDNIRAKADMDDITLPSLRNTHDF